MSDMKNRYYVKIRLFNNLPDMPEHGKYVSVMIEADNIEEIEMLLDDKHSITMCDKSTIWIKQVCKVKWKSKSLVT